MVFAATIIIVVIFVPLLFLRGLRPVSGRLLTYMVSMLASFWSPSPLTPALCGSSSEATYPIHLGKNHGWPEVSKRIYRPTLEWALGFRGWVLGAAAMATLATIVLATTFGLVPSLVQRRHLHGLRHVPSGHLSRGKRSNRRPGRETTDTHRWRGDGRKTYTGRAERDEHAEPVSNSEIEVTISGSGDQRQVRDGIDRVLSAIPGMTTMIGQPIEHRLSHLLSGTPAAIAINIYEDNLDELRRVAKKIEAELKDDTHGARVNANREVPVSSCRTLSTCRTGCTVDAG